jgi:hypothetical protein
MGLGRKDKADARGRRSFLKAGVGAAATTAAVGTSLVAGQQGASAEPILPLYLPVAPTRIYDSRLPGRWGPIKAGQLVTLTKGPAEWDWAYCVNLTITDTVGSGWIALTMAGTPFTGTSSIGWYTSGQGVANNALVEVRESDSGIDVRCGGGGGQAQFILDIIGVISFADIGAFAAARANGDTSARWYGDPSRFVYTDQS